jgi:hypothetical protein
MTYFEVWISRSWSPLASASVDNSTCESSEDLIRSRNSGSQRVVRYRVLNFDESETCKGNWEISESPAVRLLVCKGVAKGLAGQVSYSLVS